MDNLKKKTSNDGQDSLSKTTSINNGRNTILKTLRRNNALSPMRETEPLSPIRRETEPMSPYAKTIKINRNHSPKYIRETLS